MDGKGIQPKLQEYDAVSENVAVEIQEITNDETKSKCSAKSNEAGPSRFENLPGTVTPKSTILTKTGLSKSEVNIRKTVTNSDTGNVTLTSLSFEPNTPKGEDQKLDKIQISMDLKQFVASCFKINQENKVAPKVVIDTAVPVKEIPNLPNYTEISETVKISPQAPNVSLSSEEGVNASDAKANVQIILNEATVQVVNHVGLQSNTIPKLPKVPSEISNKKKTSGNTSERSDLGLTQRDSLSSIGSNVCRICMTRGRERLISPCNCKGSLASVHLSCLERWLNQVGRNHCELCGFSYPAIRTPRYTVLQALRLWFGNPRNRSHLQSDCLIFWLLSTVTAGLLAVCIVGNQYFVMGANKNGIHHHQDMMIHGKSEGASHSITETAMNFFMAIVLCGYSVTVYLLWKDHYVMWNRWRRANVNVQLLLTPDSNPVPFVPRPQYNNV